MSRLRDERGLTLIEALVTIVIGIVVLGAGVGALVSFLGQSASAERRTDAQDSARLAIDQLAIQLRSAMSGGGAGEQPIEDVSDYSIVFLAPARSPNLATNPLGLQHVRYCLGYGAHGKPSLFRQISPYDSGSNRNWPSSTGCPNGAWKEQLELGTDLVNASRGVPLFTAQRDAAGNVTSLSIEAMVDPDPVRDPPPTRLRTAVELRNVNRPPAAMLTCQPASNGHALCDASASTDPDGQTVSYAWAMNGSKLSGTGYRLDQGGLSSGSSYTFEVTVTDSGGLSATTTRSVTMP